MFADNTLILPDVKLQRELLRERPGSGHGLVVGSLFPLQQFLVVDCSANQHVHAHI